MPATYEPIATTTLGSAASSITFSSIASSWTDLRLNWTGTTSTASTVLLRFNSDSAANYSYTNLHGYGSGLGSLRSSNDNQIILGAVAANTSTTIPTFATADIFSYAGATNKTALVTSSFDLNGSGSVERTVGLWRSTSAITTINLVSLSGNFATGTTATLYGILKA